MGVLMVAARNSWPRRVDTDSEWRALCLFSLTITNPSTSTSVGCQWYRSVVRRTMCLRSRTRCMCILEWERRSVFRTAATSASRRTRSRSSWKSGDSPNTCPLPQRRRHAVVVAHLPTVASPAVNPGWTGSSVCSVRRRCCSDCVRYFATRCQCSRRGSRNAQGYQGQVRGEIHRPREGCCQSCLAGESLFSPLRLVVVSATLTLSLCAH